MNKSLIEATNVERFAEDGYVALRQFVSGIELSELYANVDRYIQDVIPQMRAEHVFYEDKSDPASLKQLQHLGDYDRWFGELFTNSPFREVAELLLDAPVLPKNLQYFNKPPGTGLPTPPHQDGFYLKLQPCEALTMWLALDAVDEENGCVRYIPGSHRQGLRQHVRTTTLGFSQGIIDYPTEEDQRNEVALPAEPGDLLVHHALTVHRADGNRSTTRSRRALGFICYSENAHQDSAAHTAYLRQLRKELRAAGRI